VELTQQVTNLITEAPADLQPAIAAMAPVLESAAKTLGKLSYWLGCSEEGDWLVVTLPHPQTKEEKKAIYCFSHEADLQQANQTAMATVEIPTIDLLFQLLALEGVDQLVFFNSIEFTQGRTLERAGLQRAIEGHLRQVAQDANSELC
jgi:hypothetical protein